MNLNRLKNIKLAAAKVYGLASFAFIATCSIAQASCSDVVPGGTIGPPPNVNASAWPSGACYIDFPGGHSAERERYGSQCRALDGYIGFTPDHGTGYNRCLYKQNEGPSTSSGNGGAGNGCNVSIMFPQQGVLDLRRAEEMKDLNGIIGATEQLLDPTIHPIESCKDDYERIHEIYTCLQMAARYFKTGSISPYKDSDLKVYQCAIRNSRDLVKNFLARYEADKIRAAQPAPAPPTPPLPQPSLPAAQPKDTNGNWGAYVQVFSTKFYGVAKGYSTEKAAIAAAMNMCRIQQDNGITTGMTAGMDTREKCEVSQTVNNGCISVAMYDGAWGVAVGDNEKEANTEALDACGDKRCRVSHQRSLCSLKSTSAFSPGDQTSGDARGNSSRNSVQICAVGRRNADVVLLYKEPNTGKWIKRGWYNIKSGACMGELIVRDGDVYLYAHDPNEESATWSGSDARQCVPRDVFTRYRSAACEVGEMNVGFQRIVNVSGGTRYKHQLSD